MDALARSTEKPQPRHLLLLLVACGGLFLPGLALGLFRNEGLRALPAVEVLRDNESWLTPTLHGEPQLTKPPGQTLLILLASLPSGHVTPITARLPSIAASVAIVLAFYLTFASHSGPRAGILAALIVPCSFLWLDRVPSAEIDLVQTTWVSLSLLFLAQAIESSEAGLSSIVRWAWWQAAILCVAGGFLTKWTAPAFFYLTAFPLLAWRKQLRLLFAWPHLLAAFLASLPCLGWLLFVIHEVGWEKVADTVGREALLRLSPAHHPRPYPWSELLTFPGAFLLACLPWSLIAIPALKKRFGPSLDRRGRLLWQLFLCWALINLLFWTLVPGHRTRHVLPAQPAIAGLASLVLLAWVRGGPAWQTGLRTLIAVALAAKLIFVVGVQARRTTGPRARRQGELLGLLVPEGRRIYIGRLKDEMLLFHANRPTRRVARPVDLSAGEFVLLTAEERPDWRAVRDIAHLHDAQGARLVLVQATEKEP